MKVVILGPFGAGSLADEAVLAGLLRHLAAGKHSITLLSADPARSHAIHGLKGLALPGPQHLLSTPLAYEALAQAHLLVVAGAGILNEKGKMPARAWLGALEHARRLKVKTAVVGAAAEPIADARERVRLQRLLHNFTDALSARDDESKQALMGYGLSSTRVSNNGDLILALAAAPAAAPARNRFGIVFSANLPSRREFGHGPAAPDPRALESMRALCAALPDAAGGELRIFHDDTPAAGNSLAALLDAVPGKRATLQPANCPLKVILQQMAGCEAIFSFSRHGAILAACAGTPAAAPAAETGATQCLAAFGLSDYAVPARDGAFDGAEAAAALRRIAEKDAELRSAVQQKISALARKETQNARMLELLVPKRDRYPARPPKPAAKRKRTRSENRDASDPWFTA